MLDGLKDIEEKHPNAGEARGVGFLAGLEMVVDREKEPLPEGKVAEIRSEMAQSGVLVGRYQP